VTVDRATILLVEDDAELGVALRGFLDANGYDLIWFRSGGMALDWLTRQRPELCLLDVMLPRMDGFELAGRLREIRADVPIVFLTARALKPDRLRGFSVGADDYIVKPVDEDELLARIRAVIRRVGYLPATPAGPIGVGRFVFDPVMLTLTLGAQRQTLTEREGALLALLCANRGQLVRREHILRALWKREDMLARRSMDVFVHRLRRRLRIDTSVSITTARGVGLILDVDG